MNSICTMRALYRALEEYEQEFLAVHGLGLNEAMLMCCINQSERLTPSEIAEKASLRNSHCSKLLRAIEEKGYVIRQLGETDRRQMYFTLSPSGKEWIEQTQCQSIKIPALLAPIFDQLNKTQ